MICVSLKKILITEIIFVEVPQRDHICRGSDQLYNSCKESADYICEGLFEDYSVLKKMILVKSRVTCKGFIVDLFWTSFTNERTSSCAIPDSAVKAMKRLIHIIISLNVGFWLYPFNRRAISKTHLCHLSKQVT